MKNIFMISVEGERNTDKVIEYLRYLSKKEDFNLVRFNDDDIINNIKIHINNNEINIELDSNNGIFKLENWIGWYRRGDFTFEQAWKTKTFHPTIINYLKKEEKHIHHFLHRHLTSLGGLYDEIENNKLLNLSLAKKNGLDVPETLITTKKQDVVDFLKKNKKVIIKPLHHGHIKYNDIEREKRIVSPGTKIFTRKELNNIPHRFGFSLFQQYIEKDVEIRIFYLKNKIYPMAIFSQNDEQTKIDYRNYNHENPNRNVPFKFPKVLEKRLLNLFKDLKFNTCSVDVILGSDGKFYFLEINPTGQYGWVSKNCNYYLDKEIANHLLKMKKMKK